MSTGMRHLHKYPAVIRAIKQEMLQAGIKCVARRPQNYYFQKNAIRGALAMYGCCITFPAFGIPITTSRRTRASPAGHCGCRQSCAMA
ncbi:hypothetical protein ACU4GD_39685 [Cupriavidus basilensis]